MEIKVNNEPHLVELDSLKTGEGFVFKSVFYVKATVDWTKVRDSVGLVPAFGLKHGIIYFFEKGTKVHPIVVKAEVTL